MNFSKQPQKQRHSEKFQKSPFIFTQLGLVLALLIVYLALEFSTVKEIVMFADAIPDDDPTFVVSDIPEFSIKKKVVERQAKAKKLVPLIDVTTTPDDPGLIETVLDPPDDNPIADIINTIVEAPEGGSDEDVTFPFIVIEDAPIFPGCEGLDSLASKQCFTKKISKFVNKRFDTSLAEELNIVGKQRIWVEFKIDKTGKVADIIAKSPYKRLEKEAIRVVQKLPQMTPGKQRKRPVAVKYTLPIVFFIE